jgi:U3 small nucleolar RNA-associated protein 22
MGNAKFDHEKNVFLTTKVCHGIIQLAPSGKWPDDLIAIKHLKAAFHLHLAKQIRDQNMECHARGQMNHVDILYEGYLFRLQIIHPKEIVLMKQHQDKAKTVSKDTPDSLKMEMGAYILPKLTSSLHALHLQQPAFGASVRMAKRWLNSQLIDSHLWPEECTELIMASIFLKTDVQRAPVQPQTGFFKFLHFLAQTDFNTDMVIVNFNDELKREELEVLDTKFINARSSFPALSVVTSCDFGKQGLWTKKAPILPVLNRVAMLAKSALETINTSVLHLDDAVVKVSLNSTPLLLIKLLPFSFE